MLAPSAPSDVSLLVADFVGRAQGPESVDSSEHPFPRCRTAVAGGPPCADPSVRSNARAHASDGTAQRAWGQRCATRAGGSHRLARRSDALPAQACALAATLQRPVPVPHNLRAERMGVHGTAPTSPGARCPVPPVQMTVVPAGQGSRNRDGVRSRRRDRRLPPRWVVRGGQRNRSPTRPSLSSTIPRAHGAWHGRTKPRLCSSSPKYRRGIAGRS